GAHEWPGGPPAAHEKRGCIQARGTPIRELRPTTEGGSFAGAVYRRRRAPSLSWPTLPPCGPPRWRLGLGWRRVRAIGTGRRAFPRTASARGVPRGPVGSIAAWPRRVMASRRLRGPWHAEDPRDPAFGETPRACG
ncbi:hypothetical protein HPB47_006015, partial [Ixodes persulcatus]